MLTCLGVRCSCHFRLRLWCVVEWFDATQWPRPFFPADCLLRFTSSLITVSTLVSWWALTERIVDNRPHVRFTIPVWTSSGIRVIVFGSCQSVLSEWTFDLLCLQYHQKSFPISVWLCLFRFWTTKNGLRLYGGFTELHSQPGCTHFLIFHWHIKLGKLSLKYDNVRVVADGFYLCNSHSLPCGNLSQITR